MSSRPKAARRSAPDIPSSVPGYSAPAPGEDPELDRVVERLLNLDPTGARFAGVLRDTWDQLYDGQRTGRWSPEQLHKTEKTHMGTLVEINLQREFGFGDGAAMDYEIAGVDVDCKFSKSLGGWMLPVEAYEHHRLCLVVWADEHLRRWEAGVVRVMPRSDQVSSEEPDDLLGSTNRDLKRSLTAAGESRVRWLYNRPSLPENLLLHIDPEVRTRIFNPLGTGSSSGQERVNMLFRLVQRRVVNRGSLVTVAQQQDSPKRARDARLPKHLGREGILVLGHQEADPLIAADLGLPVPRKGDFVSARVHPAASALDGPTSLIDGQLWRLARDGDPVVPAPPVRRAGRD